MLIKRNLVASNKSNRSVLGAMSLLGTSIELDYTALDVADVAAYIPFGAALPPGAIFQASRIQVLERFRNLADDIIVQASLGLAEDGVEYGDYVEALNAVGNYYGSETTAAPAPKFAGGITPIASFLSDGLIELGTLTAGRAIVNIYYTLIPNVR
jgi:hypothetical protein